MCIGANSSDVAMLVRKFYNYQYVVGDTMATHLEKLPTMRAQLKDLNQEPTEEVFIDRILRTLPDDYEKLKDNWDFMHASMKTTKELKQLILDIEEKSKQAKFEPTQPALFLARQREGHRRLSIEEKERQTHCAKCGHNIGRESAAPCQRTISPSRTTSNENLRPPAASRAVILTSFS